MYKDPILWSRVHTLFFMDKASKRRIIRETGLHWRTLNRILENPFPVPFRKQKSYCRRKDLEINTVKMIDAACRTIIQSLPHCRQKHCVPELLETLSTSLKDYANNNSAQCDFNNSTRWLHDIMQRQTTLSKIQDELGPAESLPLLFTQAFDGTSRDRNRAVSVLGRLKGISGTALSQFLGVSRASISRYWMTYKKQGGDFLFDHSKQKSPPKMCQNNEIREAFFSIFHSPPSDHDINRTTWKLDDLAKILRKHGLPMGKDVMREMIKSEGFKWRKARKVLTSNDPEYRRKVDNIKSILSNLRENERFFSIDEYGPFPIRSRGGRKRVLPNEYPTIPQYEKSKGFLIATAALELSTNQVTHFYSEKKNTTEMIKLLDILLEQYRDCSTLYFSWDAASWHASKRFLKHVEEVNSIQYRGINKTPEIELAPLPAGAQFLNVIESVFSGLAKAVVHNSDYASSEDCKHAIDRYFEERNQHFRKHPKKAGKKIWGEERVPSTFSEAHNCKNPTW